MKSKYLLMFLMPAFMYVFNYSVKYVILFLFDSNRHITHWISVFRFSMRTFRSYLTEKNTRNNNFAFLTRPPRLAGSRKVRERGQDTPNDHFLQRFIFFPLSPSSIVYRQRPGAPFSAGKERSAGYSPEHEQWKSNLRFPPLFRCGYFLQLYVR